MSGTEMNAASVDGGWCLNGRKEVVTNIRRANALVLFTRTGPGEGSRNHSQLLVDKERVLGGGIRYLPRHGTVGLRGVQLAGAVFEDCRLGPEALIGRQGHGLETAMRSFQVTRATLPAMMTPRSSTPPCARHCCTWAAVPCTAAASETCRRCGRSSPGRSPICWPARRSAWWRSGPCTCCRRWRDCTPRPSSTRSPGRCCGRWTGCPASWVRSSSTVTASRRSSRSSCATSSPSASATRRAPPARRRSCPNWASWRDARSTRRPRPRPSSGSTRTSPRCPSARSGSAPGAETRWPRRWRSSPSRPPGTATPGWPPTSTACGPNWPPSAPPPRRSRRASSPSPPPPTPTTWSSATCTSWSAPPVCACGGTTVTAPTPSSRNPCGCVRRSPGCARPGADARRRCRPRKRTPCTRSCSSG
ncbi:acyl-CoA dehydrogenase family protein [Streptomyces sp. S1A(2023)]